MAGADPADAVAHVDPVETTGASNRPAMNREDHRVAPLERNNLDAGLHPGPLLGQDELSPREIRSGRRKQHRDLTVTFAAGSRVMSRHGFGRGEYRYFAYPLPEMVQRLRSALYPRLRPSALRSGHAQRAPTTANGAGTRGVSLRRRTVRARAACPYGCGGPSVPF